MDFNSLFKVKKDGRVWAKGNQPIEPQKLNRAGRKEFANAMIARGLKVGAAHMAEAKSKKAPATHKGNQS